MVWVLLFIMIAYVLENYGVYIYHTNEINLLVVNYTQYVLL